MDRLRAYLSGRGAMIAARDPSLSHFCALPFLLKGVAAAGAAGAAALLPPPLARLLDPAWAAGLEARARDAIGRCVRPPPRPRLYALLRDKYEVTVPSAANTLPLLLTWFLFKVPGSSMLRCLLATQSHPACKPLPLPQLHALAACAKSVRD